MFGTSTEKRVAREADKIVSLKEDMDAISWSRVLEIGNGLLQEGIGEPERIALARELVSIAQSNRSLYTRLGIDLAPAPSRVMASGIEVLEGGLAEAAIEERVERRALSSTVEPRPNEPKPPAEEPSESDFQAAGVQAERDLVATNDPDENDFIEAADAVTDVDSPPAPSPGEVSVPVTLEDLMRATARLEKTVDDLAAAVDSLDETVEEPMQAKPEPAEGPAPEEEPKAPAAVREPKMPAAPVEPAGAKPEETSSPQPQEKPRPEPEPEAAPPAKPPKKRRFARFRNLYESRDGSLCVFEDEHGHLVAVDSSKLA